MKNGGPNNKILEGKFYILALNYEKMGSKL